MIGNGLEVNLYRRIFSMGKNWGRRGKYRHACKRVEWEGGEGEKGRGPKNKNWKRPMLFLLSSSLAQSPSCKSAIARNAERRKSLRWQRGKRGLEPKKTLAKSAGLF
jgi:hypothetical protein